MTNKELEELAIAAASEDAMKRAVAQQKMREIMTRPVPTSAGDSQRSALEGFQRELEKRLAELNAKEAQLAKEQAKMQEAYTTVSEPQAILAIPNFSCPECRSDLSVETMPDALRIRVRHSEHRLCSRSKTQFFRPLSDFVKFI